MKNLKNFEEFSQDSDSTNESKLDKIKRSNPPLWHQIQIAKRTLKMNPVGVAVMGGMTTKEAEELLDKHGIKYEKTNESVDTPDVYNITFNYLQKKYPNEKKSLITSISNKLIKARTKKEREEIKKSITEDDYAHIIDNNLITDMDDKELYLLLTQYYHNSSVIKKELLNKLQTMGIIE